MSASAGSAQSAQPSSAPAATEVFVRGQKTDLLKRASGSSTLISEQEIKRSQAENTGEILRRVPGVQIRQEDPSGFRLNIGVRGLSPVRSRLVLVEEDGVPVVVSPYGEPELYYMPAVERIARIDVQKGSDVLRHGPQTVGAVIALHTWEPTEKRSWYAAGTIGTRAFGEALLRYSDTLGEVGFLVQAMHKWGAGYRNMPFHASEVLAKARYMASAKSSFKLKLGVHGELANTTYTGLTDALYQQNPRQDTVAPHDHFGIRRDELALTHEYRFSDDTKLNTALFAYRMDLNLRLQDFDRNRYPQADYERILDPSGLFFRNTASLRHRTYEVIGFSSQVEQRLLTGPVRHKITGGVRALGDFARRKLSRGQFTTAKSGDLLADDDTQILGLGAFVEDQLGIGDLVALTPAFRIEHSESWKTTHRLQDDTRAPHDVHLQGSSRSTGLMPGVSLIVGTPRLNGFSSFYLGYSAPRVSQAIRPDGKDTELKAERSINAEIGARGRLGNWLRAEADGFVIAFDNQLVSNNPLSGSHSEFVNGGRTRHLGAEATLSVRVGAALALPLDIDLSGQYTFVSARFVGGSFAAKVVPYSPAHTTTATLDLAHKIGLSAQFAFSYIGAQFSDELNSIIGGPTGLDGQIPAYTALDANLRYYNAYTGLSLSGAVKNMLDKVYITDRLPNGIFTAGYRQFFVTISWQTKN